MTFGKPGIPDPKDDPINPAAFGGGFGDPNAGADFDWSGGEEEKAAVEVTPVQQASAAPSLDIVDPYDVGPHIEDVRARVDKGIELFDRLERETVEQGKKPNPYLMKDTASEYLLYFDLVNKREVPNDIQWRLEQNQGNVFRSPSEHLNDSTLNYAQALYDFLKGDYSRMKKGQLTDLGQRIKDDFERAMQRLRLPLNPYSQSLSWAYWDIAKQMYMAAHPRESSSEYRLGNPFEDSGVVEDIINRHLGWELHQKWQMPESRPNLERVLASKSNRSEIEALLNKPGKSDNNTLSSHELTKLGQFFRS